MVDGNREDNNLGWPGKTIKHNRQNSLEIWKSTTSEEDLTTLSFKNGETKRSREEKFVKGNREKAK